MKPGNVTPRENDEKDKSGESLRRQAEEKMRATPDTRANPVTSNEMQKIIHELQVHQIELEIQAEELKEAHLALEESRDKYLDLYDFAPVGYITLTGKALIAEVNLTGASLLGKERKDLLRAPFSKSVAGTDTDAWYRYFMSVLKQTEKQSCTLMLMRSDGSTFPARLDSIRIPDISTGTPLIRIAISDITDIRLAEKACADSEMRFRLLLRNAQDMIFVHELTPEGPGKFLEVNDKTSTILGYSRNELLGMTISDIEIPEQKPRVPAIMAELTASGHAMFITENLAKDGHRVPVEVSAVLFDLQGKPTVLAIVRDISDRRRMETALRETNKKLSLLSSITRHDINNKLITINGYVEFLHKKIRKDPECEKLFEKITTASSQISAIIRFTKEYEKVGVETPVWQNCSTLANSAAAQAPSGRILVKNDLPAGLEVFADPLITRVFSNLVDNAVRHGGKITTIRFFMQESGDNRIIVCEDDGDGIAADEKEVIFERGFGKNTGLGLTLSREILAITGLTITETGEPGTGARFEIAMPKTVWRMAGSDSE